MEKKQGFFAALKEGMVTGLSPGRSRSRSRSRSESPSTSPMSTAGILQSRLKNEQLSKPPLSELPEFAIARSRRSRAIGKSLAPLVEGPDPYATERCVGDHQKEGWSQWVRGQFSRAHSVSSRIARERCSDIRLLLGVMGAPLAPTHVSYFDHLPHLSVKDTPIESSSAQYILQQYIASSGGSKLQSFMHNAYVMGKIKMTASEFETATMVAKNRSSQMEKGSFVLWQRTPDMWYVELSVSGSKIHAGSNGKLVWRHTPWLGAHAAKGPARPLRRAVQGLDPLTTAGVFANARFIGEKKVKNEDCFVLKLSAEPDSLKSRSGGEAEIIRHLLFGYFSQRTGLLVYMEDSHLTRIQSNSGGDAVYWETTINTFIQDYRPMEGVMIACGGRSMATLFRFGETAMSHRKTTLEEVWTIEEVAFNVPGLSLDCFIPPADLGRGSMGKAEEGENGWSSTLGDYREKVSAFERSSDAGGRNVIWRVEV